MARRPFDLTALQAVAEITEVIVADDGLQANVTVVPPDPFLAEGFPLERVRIVLSPSGRPPKVFPAESDGRRWRHMYGDGSLCMWHPKDHPALRWMKADGEEMLGKIIVRHLVHEEVWRRTGEWPVEESAHRKGGRNRYRTMPPRTKEMRMARKRWSR